MARIRIIYSGMDFYSGDDPETPAEKMCELLYADFERCHKLKVELENGNFLLIGENVLKSCVILFED